MSARRWLPIVLALAVAPAALLACRSASPRTTAASGPLRVCADPDNLPFTNRHGDGFENRIAELLARDLGTRLEYTWWAQRRSFLRLTLNAGRCDVVLGLPAGIERARTTRPYYRSTYVFVSREERHLDIRSASDPRLRRLRIGVPVIGDDGESAPPGHLLAREGLADRLVGFMVAGNTTGSTPLAAPIEAVARGDVDVAAAWGPVAGYFAALAPEVLTWYPIAPPADTPALPMAFDIAMATRRDDTARHDMLEAFLDRRRGDIDRILAGYHVPRVDHTFGDAAP
jgi:mxaJ protein